MYKRTPLFGDPPLHPDPFSAGSVFLRHDLRGPDSGPLRANAYHVLCLLFASAATLLHTASVKAMNGRP